MRARPNFRGALEQSDALKSGLVEVAADILPQGGECGRWMHRRNRRPRATSSRYARAGSTRDCR
jgi:hypothetical protein